MSQSTPPRANLPKKESEQPERPELTITANTAPLEELVDSLLKERPEFLLDAVDGLSEFVRVESRFSAAGGTHELLVTLYPSDAFLRLAGATLAR